MDGIFSAEYAENIVAYIHDLPDWPHLRWGQEALSERLAAVRHRQGRLIGRMEALGLSLRNEAMLSTLTQDVVKSSEIEGDILDTDQVRSSIARRLGIDIGALTPADREVEGVVEMTLDATGFPQPTGEFETLEADSVVLALGQDVDLSLLNGVPGLEIRDGVVQVGRNMMTGHAGIFAGGDMVPSERTVTVAVGHGKKAARHIDAWLRGADYAPQSKHELATFDKLNTWYYSDAPKTVRPMLDLIRRQSTFDAVQGGLDEGNALFEARRCLSCGNCFECDNCYGVCPDNAVIKLGPGQRFAFNYDYCKGCGICVAECPCGAIKMVPESI